MRYTYVHLDFVKIKIIVSWNRSISDTFSVKKIVRGKKF